MYTYYFIFHAGKFLQKMTKMRKNLKYRQNMPNVKQISVNNTEVAKFIYKPKKHN